VLKAHAHVPNWTRNNSLTPECRQAFEAVNLTFHDLRHEAGSRLLAAARNSPRCNPLQNGGEESRRLFATTINQRPIKPR